MSKLNTDNNKEKILFVSHKNQQCGVYQYGINIIKTIQKSERYCFVYKECSNREELLDIINQLQPKSIIYNYHQLTLPWFNQDLKEEISIPQIGIIHEVTQELVNVIKPDLFDYYIAPDPTLFPNNPIVFKTGRLVPKYVNTYTLPSVITIGSFGFATAGKGFEKLIIAVQNEFDEAIIKLHIPVGEFASLDSQEIISKCKQLVVKPKIKLLISHDFLDDSQLLSFLAQNTINVFLYEEHKNRGISSVIDYALAVNRPIGITDSNMFRHITSDKSFLGNNMTIFIANRGVNDYGNLCKLKKILVKTYIILKRMMYSKNFKGKIPGEWLWIKKKTELKEIINQGTQYLQRFVSEWSPENLALDYERILDRVLNKLSSNIPIFCSFEKLQLTSVGIPNIVLFNRILDNSARDQYKEVINKLRELSPEVIERKIPEANIQQAFVLDTVEKFASQIDNPKMLCIGSFEDTAAISLKKLNYKIEEVDPVINYDLSTFFHNPSTLNGSYNIIFSTSVLEHIRNDELFITQIVKLLDVGGIAILTFDYDDRYHFGDQIPLEDYRLYTQKDLKERIIPLLVGCSLVDEPNWDCPNPDFTYVGKYNYTFATLVFQKNNL